jgi:hypothetical protein
MICTFRTHDVVVFRKQKHGAHPGVRAHDVRPAPLGEDYDYLIDKYWIVVRVTDDGQLLLRTPGGKLHEISVGDPNLRRLTLRERLWLSVFDRQRLRALRHPGD